MGKITFSGGRVHESFKTGKHTWIFRILDWDLGMLRALRILGALTAPIL